MHTKPLARLGAAFLTTMLIAAAFFLLTSAFVPTHAYATRDYGSLCSKYESGNDPAEVDPGSAYGAYQMSPGNAYTFSVWLKAGAGHGTSTAEYATCVKWGKALVKGYKKDGSYTGAKFDAAWKACSTENRTLFFNSQYTYCKVHYYDEAVAYWKKLAPGFNPSNYTKALSSAIFSCSLQHGPYGSAYYVFKKALVSLGGWSKNLKEDQIIDAVYKERAAVTATAPSSSAHKITKGSLSSSVWKQAKKYGINGMYLSHFYSCSAAVQVAIYNRLYNNERADAFALFLKSGGKDSHKALKGGGITYKESACTDTTHTMHVDTAVCELCGKKINGKETVVARHSFKYHKRSRVCACGAKYVVHKRKSYYSCKASVTMYADPAASSAKVGAVPAGTMVLVTSATKGKDSNWWGKVSVGEVTGYVRLASLKIHGPASGGHVFVDGKCTYCKATKAQTKMKKGKYVCKKKTYQRAAAYTASKKGGKVKKGTKVKVVKVVSNCFGQIWGRTSNGKYVDLSRFKAKK